MKELLVPIDRAGRLVLPKDIRAELAIKPGDTFKVSINGLSVTLTPITESAGFVRKGKALVFSTPVGKSVSNDEVNAILAASRDEIHLPALGKNRRRMKR